MGDNTTTTEPAGIGALVLGKDGVEDMPEIGEIVEANGRGHAVVGIRGNYKLERDRWEVVIKLEPIREPRIHGEDPPEWVREAVPVDDPNA